MAKMKDTDDLYDWLTDKPAEWAQVIAARAALRAFPHVVEADNREVNDNLFLAAARGNIIGWIARNYPRCDVSSAASSAFEFESSDEVSRAAYSSADSVRAAYFAAYALIHDDPADIAARTAGYAFGAAEHAALGFQFSIAGVGARVDSDKTARINVWDAFFADATWLEKQSDIVRAPRALSNRPLWLSAPFEEWWTLWDDTRRDLLAANQNFTVWTDWYERRIRGKRSAFDIHGDYRRTEDKWLLRKIADATDEDFWDRGAGYVNSTLTKWLEEARERAARNLEQTPPLTDIIDNSLDAQIVRAPVPLPAPSENALRFGRDDKGQVTLAPETNLGDLKTDADARDRHELALDEAKALLAACEGSNSAERLSNILRAYIKAAGESVETMRPSAYVQRGERLRQELAKYEAPDTDLPPLSDAIITDLGSVCKAHNMVVGLDPVLLDLDTAQLGPDREIGDATPAEVREVTKEADEAQILAPEVPEMMFEAVDLVPEGAGPEDRRFRWCMESGRNLIIEAFALALNHPIKTTAGMAGTVTIGPPVLVGSALGSAQFLLDRRDWIEEKLGRHAPTWTDLFAHLCDLLEETKNKRSED